MNLAQIRAVVRDALSGGGGTNTEIPRDTFWADSEIDAYINAAQNELYKIIRRARSDYFTRILRTTDSPLQINSSTFDPATLRWVADVGNYQLPLDFTRMKLITDITDQPVRLTASDIAKNTFKVLMTQDQGGNTREYLYDILGVRTLIIRPIPQDVRDFEFIYEKTLPVLRDKSAGTIDVIQDNTTVTFSSGANIQKNLMVGHEILVGTMSDAPTVDVNRDYPTIKSIDSATQATLEGPYPDASESSAKYIASPVSEIPIAHHWLMVAWAVILAFKKGTNPHTDSINEWQTLFNGMLPSLVGDVEIRQGSDPEFVESFLEDQYD